MDNLKNTFKEQYDEVLANIADLYYNHNKTQAEIAKEFNTTRFKIAKYLQEAKDRNIITIIINHQEHRMSNFEKELKNQFGLKEAIVLKVNDSDAIDSSETIGKSAAQYIDSLIQENSTIGITWGKTLYQTIRHIKEDKNKAISIIQPFGMFGKRNLTVDTPNLIKILSSKFNANCRFIYSPLYIIDDFVRKNLKMEIIINRTLLKLQKMNTIITGIGTPEAIFSTTLWKEFFQQNDVNKNKAVGVIFGRLYDKNGVFLDIPLNTKVFGADIDLVCSVENRICIANSKFKAEAILGALRGNLINSLITDELTARKIFNLNDSD